VEYGVQFVTMAGPWLMQLWYVINWVWCWTLMIGFWRDQKSHKQAHQRRSFSGKSNSRCTCVRICYKEWGIFY